MTADASPRPSSDIERQALQALRRMRERLEAAEAARHEPLAIVGLGCRLPGADGPEAFWELLARGGDAVVDIPDSRWDVARYSRPDPHGEHRVLHRAGLLDDVQRFDADFFGISGREAQCMDPQHRLLLEVVWEALELAGIPSDSLRGSRTGVFIGLTTTDYLRLLTDRLPPAQIDAYVASGNTLNAAAGRISYLLGLHGPSIAMDTACSSSLVAIDRACRSLRDGECRMAIAGGVNLLLAPEMLMSLSRWGMLAPDGRCKTFDAAADGFVRAEGCGVVLLKRLSDAQADGDRIWALVRGSAVNQDGPSSGLTVPNGLAQAAVFREALANARVAPTEVSYVETHGTGTTLGDPIEVEAIATVYGPGREAVDPLCLGAVKTNVGHLEAASGVTGLIKVVLAMQHRQIPANVHFHTPSPHIDWTRLPVLLPTRMQPWSPRQGRRLAAVSGFGFSGTNAHVVLEEAPAAAGDTAAPPGLPPRQGPWLLTLSARCAPALAELALRHADHLQARPEADLAAYTLAASAARAHGPHRLAVTGADAAGLVETLRRTAGAADGGAAPAGVWTGQPGRGRRPRVAFVYTGQGAQYPGMGRALAAAEPVFRDALAEAAAVIDPLIGASLLDRMWSDDAAGLSQTALTQPALFAIEWALTRLWLDRGVVPAVVMGHSVGEFAAACCAGVLTLEEAARLVVRRGALMQALPAGGAMAAVMADESTVQQVIQALPAGLGPIAPAGLNADDETVVSGASDAVAALCSALVSRGVRCEPLTVSHAFHSPLMQPMLAALDEAARALQPRAATIPIVSTLTGAPAEADWGSAAYWVRQAAAPVRHAQAIRAVAAQGVTHVMELGPHPVLCGLGRRCLPDAGITWLGALRRGPVDVATDRATLAQAYVDGVVHDWSGVAGRQVRTAVSLPRYPYQRQRYWIDLPADGPGRTERARHDTAGAAAAGLLGRRLRLAGDAVVHETEAGAPAHALLREHRLRGRTVWPGSATVELALQAAQQHLGPGPLRLASVQFQAPLVLPDDGSVTVQTVLRPQGPGEWAAACCHAPGTPPDPADNSMPWPVFAQATLARGAAPPASEPAPWAPALARCTRRVEPGDFYDRLRDQGVEFGPAFRSLQSIQVGPGEAVGRVACNAPDQLGGQPVCLHPVLLDGCFHLAFLAGGGADADGLWVPQQVEQLHWWHAADTALWCHARLHEDASPHSRRADLSIWDERGQAVARVDGLVLRQAEPAEARPGGAGALLAASLVPEWQAPDEHSAEPAAGAALHGLLVHEPADAPLAVSLAQALTAQGAELMMLAEPADVATALMQAQARWPGRPLQVLACQGWSAPAQGALAGAAMAHTLGLVQALIATQAAAPMRLWVLTRAAQAVRAGESVHPLAAAWWGLARSAGTEHPALQASLLDLPGDPGTPDWAAAARAIATAAPRETQWAVRGGELRVLRHLPLPERHEWRLLPAASGQIDDLQTRPMPRPVPGPREVLIDVLYAGLNFRDVLCVLGVYPGTVDALGGECAGVVAAVGPGVTDLAVGDEVMAFAPGSLGTAVCVPQAFVVPRPRGLSREQAAALPVAAMTASHALEHLAALRPGESVLIHAATGGVGSAAVQLARLLGAQVHATAGSPAKRDALRAQGVVQVYDSRSLSFRDELLAATGGRGVDVVLNALAGEFVTAGLDVLAPGGRFLEMGKRDLLDPAQVAARWPGRRYLAFDVGDDCRRQPALAATLLATLVQRLEAGQLQPLPVEVHRMSSPQEALRAMAQGRHSGKLVLHQDLQPPATAARIRADGRYLVTGGLGALGLAVARGLVERGARHLVLLSRRAPGADAQAVLDELAAAGTDVQVVQGDVAELRAGRTERRFDDTAPPWRGVVHAAGVLDDALVDRLDVDRLDALLAPKLGGALQLDAVLQDAELDFCVAFSAGAAWLGAPGQAAYAAANATLDAWAAARRARGLPGQSIAWGRWAAGGMAAARDDSGWENLGVTAIPTQQGVEVLFELIGRGATQAAVLPLDWPRYLARLHGQQVPRCHERLLRHTPVAASVAAPAAQALRDRLAEAPADTRAAVLARELETLLRRIVGMPASQPVDPQRPLRELGMDSLMTVELRNAIAQALDLRLPATLVFDHPTLQALTAHLLTQLSGPGAPSGTQPAPPPAAAPSATATEVRSMSDAEAEAELLRELGQGG